MGEAPVLPSVKPRTKCPPPIACALRSDFCLVWSSERNEPVEAVTADRYCAELRLQLAVPMVPAELVPGAARIVRLRAAARCGRMAVGDSMSYRCRSLAGVGPASLRRGALRRRQLPSPLLKSRPTSVACRISGASGVR